MNCQVVGLGAMGVPAVDLHPQSERDIQIQSIGFSQCGQLQITANDAADVTIVGNDSATTRSSIPAHLSPGRAGDVPHRESSAIKHFQGIAF